MIKNLLRKLIPESFLGFYHLCLNFLGAFYYGFPSRKLKVIGVTGTNGKTTAVNLIYEILKSSGLKSAAFSSLNFRVGETIKPNLLKMTMPGRWKLQRLLSQAVKMGCGWAVIEVTSEGIKQYRHRFIKFYAAVLTNIRPEHIEAHGSFENYVKAKTNLFAATKGIHVINLDEPLAKRFLSFEAREKWGYSVRHDHDDDREKNIRSVTAEDLMLGKDGSKFKVQGLMFQLDLPGLFNVHNALAAICAALAIGVKLPAMQETLKNFGGVPGRMEIIQERPFRVVVDYAHTPDALENVYQTLSMPNREAVQGSKLICVLGSAGGGRDKWKRPDMGIMAARYCDHIILTNEDPYDENPLAIIKDIESGFSRISNPKSQIPEYEKILDRREAIKKALALARPGNTVIITGKGSEPWMCLAGNKKIPWDDRKIVQEFLGLVKKTRIG